MKKSLPALLLLAATSGISFGAAIPQTNIDHRSLMKGLDLSQGLFPSEISTARARATKGTVNVNFILKEINGAQLTMFYLHDAATGEIINVWGADELGTVSVPSGRYTVCAQGKNSDKEILLLFDEDIDILSDMDYALDFSKCVNHLQFRVTLPDGRMAKTYSKDIETQEYDMESGNYRMGVWRLFYNYIDRPAVIAYGFTDRAVYKPTNLVIDNEKLGDVWINPVSDRLSIFQTRITPFDEGGVMVRINGDTHEPGIQTNKARNLKFYDIDFVKTKASEGYDTKISGFNMATYWDGYPVDENYLSSINDLATENFGKIWVDFPDGNIPGRFTNVALPHSYELDTNGKGRIGIVGPGLSNCLEHDFASIYNTFGVMSGNKFLLDRTGYISGEKMINEALSFNLPSDGKIILGNSIPLCALQPIWLPDKEDYIDRANKSLWFGYVGRFGEVHEVDQFVATGHVKLNGSQIEYGYYPTTQTGEWVYEIENRNAAVDGMEGYNRMTLTIDDRDGNTLIPTAQMLQFRNSDGEVTDRFNTREEGEVRIFAGNFKCDADMNYFSTWIEPHQAEDVILEYSPMGEEKWAILDLERKDDMFHRIGFGDCYVGTLDKVTQESPSKWYDVRLTVKGKGNNVQTQVISPAFKVENTTNGIIEIISPEGGSIFYTLDGMKSEWPETGKIYIERRSDGTSRKVMMR